MTKLEEFSRDGGPTYVRLRCDRCGSEGYSAERDMPPYLDGVDDGHLWYDRGGGRHYCHDCARELDARRKR